MSETTCAECGATITKCPSQIKERNFCNRACLGKYRSKHYVGERAANWQGGSRYDRDRVMVYAPNSPMANAQGYVYRYRLVAAEKIGRQLRPDEIVHHIDGDESNDDPANLLVMTQAEHASRFDARRPVQGEIPAHCGNGHELTDDNLYTYERNGLMKWTCKTCRREYGRRYDAQRREKVRYGAV